MSAVLSLSPVLVEARPLRPVYQQGAVCPCCSGRAWYIGRQSVECARCGEALPFAAEARP